MNDASISECGVVRGSVHKLAYGHKQATATPSVAGSLKREIVAATLLPSASMSRVAHICCCASGAGSASTGSISTPANRPRATAPISRSPNGPLALSARNAAAARSISSSRRGLPGAPSRALRPTRPRQVIHPGAGAAQAGAQRRYAQCAARPADPAVQRRPERSGYPDPPLVPLVSAKRSSGTAVPP